MRTRVYGGVGGEDERSFPLSRLGQRLRHVPGATTSQRNDGQQERCHRIAILASNNFSSLKRVIDYASYSARIHPASISQPVVSFRKTVSVSASAWSFLGP